MKKIFIYSLMLLFSFSGFAQDKIKIWENTSVHSLWSELTVYKPDPSKNNKTAIIVCPGGSYHHLGMKHEGHEVAKKFASEGFTAFVLRYRIGMFSYKHPAMIQDIQRSIALIRENAQSFEIELNNVGLIGFSAGGHLVGSAATFFEENSMKPLGIEPLVSLKPQFTVMMYPVVTMLEPYVHKRSKKNLIGNEPTDSLILKMSLEKNVHSGMNNILIIQAENDPVVDYNNAVILDQALQKQNINHHLILHKTGGHGFGAFPDPDSEMNNWFEEVLKWVKSIKNSKE